MDEYEKFKLDRYHRFVESTLQTRLDALEDELLEIETNEPQNTNRALIIAAKCAELARTIYEIGKIYGKIEHLAAIDNKR